MSIVVICDHCQASFGAKDADAGRRGKCPKCRAEIVVPARTASPQPRARTAPAAVGQPAASRLSSGGGAKEVLPAKLARPATKPLAGAANSPAPTPTAATYDSIESVLAAFQGSIEPVRLGAGYRLGIGLVLLFMLLLPVCYVALIGLVCLLLGLHAFHDTALLHAGHGRASLLAVVVYVAPLLAGAILVFFMFKPLFARPMKRAKPRSLHRDQEPLLFAFVDRVCIAVGAPRPSRIDVDCQVNASASFRRGLWSMLGSDLVLTIGLPLVGGLNTRQFAGVLAHEFGHFSQGAGMRLSYLVRTVSFWLTRVVYERDEWDQRLVAWSQELDIRLGIIFFMARVFVWATRKTLWLLMMLGHLVSGFLLRQMEFDADCYEARLAGSDAFESTMRRIVLLDAATQGAFADLGEFASEGRLSDDFPRLIVANAGQITPEGLTLLNQKIDEEPASVFATHPASCDRIQRAHDEQATGIFHVERPASGLFRDFGALSKTCTFDLYRSLFGKGFKLTDMHPVEQLLAKQEQTVDDIKSLQRFFQGTFTVLRPLRLPPEPVTEVAAAAVASELKTARQAMLDRVSAYRVMFAEYDQRDTDWLEAEIADTLLTARIKVKPNDFRQPLVNPKAAMEARAAARARLEQLSPQLAPLEQLALRRLSAALELARAEKVSARLERARERIEECQRIRAAVAVAGGQVVTWLGLRNRMAVLAAMLPRIDGQRENAVLGGLVEKNISLLVRQVRDLQHELSRARYPFQHAKTEPTLSEFLLPQPFHEQDWNAVLSAGNTVVEGFPKLYARMFGRLTALAEDVEALLGLPRLPEPPALPVSEPSIGA